MPSTSNPVRAGWLAAALTAVLVAPSLRAANPPDGWRITLNASQAGQIDRGRLVLGSSSVAAPGYDAYDEPEPPAWPHHGLDVFTEHDRSQIGWESQPLTALRYRREFGEPLGPSDASRDLVVAASPAGNVTLVWQLTVDLDLAEHFLTLVDLQDGTQVDMWAAQQYVFAPTAAARHFRIDLRAGRSAPPIAHDQSLSTAEDTPLPVTLAATDPQGDPLTYALASAPAHGTLLGTPPDLTYHSAPDFGGADGFTFVASDASSTSSPGTITIAVLPVNDAPVAQVQALETDEDVPLPITLTGSDVDGDALSFEIVSPPAHGTLSGTAPDVVYTAAADFNGSDAFAFRVSDGALASLDATVALTVRPVNDPPVALFTVPGPARNAAQWTNNLGSYFAGAEGLAASSQSSAVTGAAAAIDETPLSSWQSAFGQTTNQSFTVSLPRRELHTIERFRLVNGSIDRAVRHFEVQLSTTTPDDGAFSTVLADVALADSRVQEFALSAPRAARFVRFVALDNHGSTCCLAVRSFEVIGAGGGVPSLLEPVTNAAAASAGAAIVSSTSQAAVFPASHAIDGNGSTRWVSANAQVSNQELVVRLARERTYTLDRVRLRNAFGSGGQSVRDFAIAVSSTTADPGAFTPVLAGTALDDDSWQEFGFPAVQAAYVRFTALNNYGSTSGLSVAELEALPVSVATPRAYSSYQDFSQRPEHLLDGVGNTVWQSANGSPANQYVKVELADGEQLVDRVRLQPWSGASPMAVRTFDVLVSTTTLDDSAFLPVLSATAVNNGLLQEFPLPSPVRARYVELLARDNYGSATAVGAAAFEVVTAPSQGNVVSIPTSAFQVARNESPALIANGAVVVAASSAYTGAPPEAMLAYSAGPPWATTSVAGQYATIQLARAATYVLSGVRVAPRRDCCPTQSVRAFEIWVSNTTSEESAFARVFEGTVLNNGLEQTFLFPAPVAARYLKYVPLSNYGDPTYIATASFDVLVPEAGGVVAASSFSPTARPEQALDGVGTTAWLTATGAVSGQWVKVALAGGRAHRVHGVRIHGIANTGPKVFEVRVSTTTAEDAAFSTVASGTLSPADAVQEVTLPAAVEARYVQFVWTSGYGASYVAVRSLEVLADSEAGARFVDASSQLSPAVQALDVEESTAAYWITAAGQNANQWLKITLPGADGLTVDHVALRSTNAGAPASPRDFEVQVSATGTDDGSFAPAFVGTLRNDGTLKHFFFPPVLARHVRLLVRNNYGDSRVGLLTFRVFSPQVGDLGARFLDRSRALDGRIVGHTWTFGDGQASNARDPQNAYASPGTYEVRLTALADTGLSGERVSPYKALGPPTAAFVFSPQAALEGQRVVFSDATVDPSGIVFQEWDFGDGTRLAGSRPVVDHQYRDNGAYTITLAVTNAWGANSSATRQITVSNADPSVSASPNRNALSGEPVAFAGAITDPGADTFTCLWDFGDGSSATGCTASHTYAALPDLAGEPVAMTASVTVTDDDGGTASASTETTLYPPRLQILTAALHLPVGVEWSPEIGKLLVTHHYPGPDQLVPLGLDGNVGAPTVTDIGVDEVNLVVSKGLGGFVRGDVYFNTGRTGQVGRLRLDTSGNVVERDNPWVTLPGGAVYGGITFDTEGGFGHDLLVTWQNGAVYRVNSSGQYSLLATLPSSGQMEGATVAGPDFGPASGCLLTTALHSATMWAVCPDGSHFAVVNLSSLTTHLPAWPRYVPAPGALFFVDWANGRVLKGDSRAFGMNLAGHVLINAEYGGEIWDVWYDAASGSYKTRLYALASIGGVAPHLEDTAYIPASGQLAPATSTVELGNSHTLSATVTDAYGIPVPNVPLTFAVTGANPTTGTATTGADGVATFAYGGTNVGEDHVVASFSVIETNAATVTWWTSDHAPVALDQATTTAEDTTTEVLLAATDADGDTLTYTVVAAPTHGTLSGTAPALTYTPAADYHGPDAFTFRANDGLLDSNVATVSVTVTPVNDPPQVQDQALALAEDTAQSVTLVATDVDGDPLTYAVVTGPTHGTLSGTAPNLTYTPAADYHGLDSITFKANDGQVDSNVATVSLTVTPVNDPPVVSPVTVTVVEDTPTVVTLQATDPDGDPLTFAVVAAPVHGTLSGALPDPTYTPAGDFHGVDAFTIVVSDGQVTTDPVSVTLDVQSVNDAPLAQDQGLSLAEDAPQPVTLVATDVDGDALSYAVVAAPAHGVLSGTPPNLTYAPAPDYHGADSITFKANDGQVDSNVATVSLTVMPVNDPPLALDQALTLAEDTAQAATLVATDADGDALTYLVVTGPTHGSLSGTAPNLTYTPAANYHGPDSLTFKANDGQVDSNVATVSLTVTPVNDPPEVSPITVTVVEDTPTPVTLQVTDPDGDPLTVTIVTAPSHGTLSGSGPNLTYTPSPDFHGADSFTFAVSDGQVTTDPVAVTLDVQSVNDPPLAQDQALSLAEDTAPPVTLVATDADGDVLTYTVVAGPSHGTLSGTTPNLTYSPASNYHGPDSFTFKANDGQIDSNAATVSLTVTPVNDPPQAQDQAQTVAEGTALPLTLVATDPDGDALTYVVVAGPSHGTLSGTAPSLSYTPIAGYSGSDGFTFKANDGQVDSNVATVTIVVTAENGRPLAEAGPDREVGAGAGCRGTVTLDGRGSSDPDGDALTYQWSAPGITFDNPASATPTAAFPLGETVVSLVVSDGVLSSIPDTALVRITDTMAPAIVAAWVPVQHDDEGEGDGEHHHGDGEHSAGEGESEASYRLEFEATDNCDPAPQVTGVVVTPSLAGLAVHLEPGPEVAIEFDLAQGRVEIAGPDVQALLAQLQALGGLAVTNGQGVEWEPGEAGEVEYAFEDDGTLHIEGGALPVLRVTARDASGNTASREVSPSNTPPHCEGARASAATLWPPNHGLRALQVEGVSDSDEEPVVVTVTRVWQDEPTNGLGDGDTSPDATLAPLKVRAERAGGGDGRVYHVDFEASDGRGGTCRGTVTACVPKSQGGSGAVCVDGGRLYDSVQQ